ncbi:MAG: ABC transporter ATP-binding protein [Deltaproteobacteria bacterium]|nr:ABC transporter ATP-binding protein [Deltaproteobacteria bacterium]
MGEEIYKLLGVSFSYRRGSYALRDINMSVWRGECLGILGANGSGKSTLLKILNGLVFPEAGTVSFMGRGLSEAALNGDFLRCFRQRVGFVFSEPDVQLFSPTVFDEVAFGPLQLDMEKDEARKRVAEVLDMLGISGLRDRAPYTLSSGEKKKVAIASVLSINPDVLLMDEPTNGLDPRTQVWLFELIESLKGLKKTCVMSTHDLSLAGDFADRVVLLDESHTIGADNKTPAVLGDKDLLLKANIIHEHTHRHGDITHIHSHGPFAAHDEHD